MTARPARIASNRRRTAAQIPPAFRAAPPRAADESIDFRRRNRGAHRCLLAAALRVYSDHSRAGTVTTAYVLAGELAAAAGTYQAAFRQYEKEMRPFVMLNQELGLKAANLMKSKERKNLFKWLLDQMMRMDLD